MIHELQRNHAAGEATAKYTENAAAKEATSTRVSPQIADNRQAGVVARQAVGEATGASVAQQVADALNRVVDPDASGVGDFAAAFNILNGQSMPVMLEALQELANQHLLEVLMSGTSQAPGVNLPRIMAAIQLVRFATANASDIQQSELDGFSNNARSLPAEQQNDMVTFISTARRISQATREGLSAMMAGDAAGTSAAGLTPAMAGGVTGGVNPGPWAPPGGQPIPFYIGNAAHIAIAASYTAAHPGDLVFTNFIPLSTILEQARTLGLNPNPGAVSGGDLALKPDILNLAVSRRHLYEIKPTRLQSAGLAEARMYVGLLAAAGVPVTLGPIGEAGTAGVIPAPGGVYMFETPEPGVIVYQYRRMRLVPVPVSSEENAREPSRRFELRPLTAQQQALVANTAVAGAGAMMLYIMMFILSPVGL